MGTILASTIATRASALLNDEDNDRWSTAELLTYLNDGEKEVCLIKPDAYIVNVSYQLALSATKQNIPDGTATYPDPDSNTIPAGIALLDIVRNMGTDGETPGNVITLVDMEQFDMAEPGWHTATASATVQHYMFRETDPKRFYVYPKQPASSMGWIEIVMAAIPIDIASSATAINLDDIYQNALIDFVMYKAFMKDAEYAANADVAARYYNSFKTALITKELREKAEEPDPSGKRRQA